MVHKRKRQSKVAPPTASASELPPDVVVVLELYERIAERCGVLCQMVQHARYTWYSGAFRTFLESPSGYNEPIDEEGAKEDWAAYCMGTLHHMIVMLHATTEDTVRTLARWRLPMCSEEALKDIPIARPDATGDGRLKELGQLVPYQGASIGDVIRTSVDVWLERQTFNSAHQVTTMLRKIGVPIEGVRVRLATIDRIANLRHQIAHTGAIRDAEREALLTGGDLTHYILDVYLFARGYSARSYL